MKKLFLHEEEEVRNLLLFIDYKGVSTGFPKFLVKTVLEKLKECQKLANSRTTLPIRVYYAGSDLKRLFVHQDAVSSRHHLPSSQLQEDEDFQSTDFDSIINLAEKLLESSSCQDYERLRQTWQDDEIVRLLESYFLDSGISTTPELDVCFKVVSVYSTMKLIETMNSNHPTHLIYVTEDLASFGCDLGRSLLTWFQYHFNFGDISVCLNNSDIEDHAYTMRKGLLKTELSNEFNLHIVSRTTIDSNESCECFDDLERWRGNFYIESATMESHDPIFKFVGKWKALETFTTLKRTLMNVAHLESNQALYLHGLVLCCDNQTFPSSSCLPVCKSISMRLAIDAPTATNLKELLVEGGLLCPVYVKGDIRKKTLKQWMDLTMEPVSSIIQNHTEITTFAPHFIIEKISKDRIFILELTHPKGLLAELFQTDFLQEFVPSTCQLTEMDRIHCETIVSSIGKVNWTDSLVVEDSRKDSVFQGSQRSLMDMTVDILCKAIDYDKKIKPIQTAPQLEKSNPFPDIQSLRDFVTTTSSIPAEPIQAHRIKYLWKYKNPSSGFKFYNTPHIARIPLLLENGAFTEVFGKSIRSYYSRHQKLRHQKLNVSLSHGLEYPSEKERVEQKTLRIYNDLINSSFEYDGLMENPLLSNNSARLMKDPGKLLELNKKRLKLEIKECFRKMQLHKSHQDFLELYKTLYSICLFRLRNDLEKTCLSIEDLGSVVKDSLQLLLRPIKPIKHLEN